MARVQLQCRHTALAVVAALRLCRVWAPASRHAVLDASVGRVVYSTWCIRSFKGFLRLPLLFRLSIVDAINFCFTIINLKVQRGIGPTRVTKWPKFECSVAARRLQWSRRCVGVKCGRWCRGTQCSMLAWV